MPTPKLPRSQRLAVTHAGAYCRGKPALPRAKQLTWRQACALAPWPQAGLAAEDEREYRECFADQLEHAGQSRGRGVNVPGIHRGVSRLLRVPAEELARQDAEAAAMGVSWNQWALGRLGN